MIHSSVQTETDRAGPNMLSSDRTCDVKVFSPGAGIEFPDPEIDCVCSRGDCGDQLRPSSSGSQDFGESCARQTRSQYTYIVVC